MNAVSRFAAKELHLVCAQDRRVVDVSGTEPDNHELCAPVQNLVAVRGELRCRARLSMSAARSGGSAARTMSRLALPGAQRAVAPRFPLYQALVPCAWYDDGRFRTVRPRRWHSSFRRSALACRPVPEPVGVVLGRGSLRLNAGVAAIDEILHEWHPRRVLDVPAMPR